jgi:hypothetical protein
MIKDEHKNTIQEKNRDYCQMRKAKIAEGNQMK